MLLIVPGMALAQSEPVSCFDCVLGLWDEAEQIHNTGTMAQFTPKIVFLGIKYAGDQSCLTGLELSVAGLEGFLVSIAAIVPASATLGTIPAPPDTSVTTEGTGGLNIAWASGLSGDQALLRITLISTSPPPPDRVLVVKRRYPTTNAAWQTPVILGCNAPFFTPARVTGACYIINPTGNPVGCQVPVTESTWTRVKQLFE
jgi:hypothetical protein